MSRTLIVIKPEMVDATNQAIAEATGNPDDIYTFTVQLLNDKEEVIGYACSWDFEATKVDFDAIRKVIETQVGATKDAAKTKLETATGDLKTDKVLVYDESKIDAKQVVSSLGAKFEKVEVKTVVEEVIEPIKEEVPITQNVVAPVE